MPDRRSRDAVPTVDHDVHVVVGRYGNIDLGCGRCGSRWRELPDQAALRRTYLDPQATRIRLHLRRRIPRRFTLHD